MTDKSNGNPPQSAPSDSYQQLMMTRPAINPDGTLALWLAQYLVRLSGIVGPGPSDSTTSITEQLSELSADSGNVVAVSAPADAATQARLSALEAAARISPLSQPPITAALSAALDQVFGATWGDVLFRSQNVWRVLPVPYQSGLRLCSGGPNADVYWGSPATPISKGLGTFITISGTVVVAGLGTGTANMVLSNGNGS